jgi:hypothetical protein
MVGWICPAVVEILTGPAVIAAFRAMVFAACNVTVADVGPDIEELTDIPPAAVSVRLRAVVHVIGVFTVISPASAPVDPTVVMVTLPVTRLLFMSAPYTLDGVPVGAKENGPVPVHPP